MGSASNGHPTMPERGAHLLLQVRTRVLNEDWRSTLSRFRVGTQE
jgi:hypothetical protein